MLAADYSVLYQTFTVRICLLLKNEIPGPILISFI
nr:MAG TPA: hypothetical protein [Caudoviricetes sp.]